MPVGDQRIAEELEVVVRNEAVVQRVGVYAEGQRDQQQIGPQPRPKRRRVGGGNGGACRLRWGFLLQGRSIIVSLADGKKWRGGCFPRGLRRPARIPALLTATQR